MPYTALDSRPTKANAICSTTEPMADFSKEDEMAEFTLPSGMPPRPMLTELMDDLIDLEDPVQCANIEACLALLRLPGAVAALASLARDPDTIAELIATAQASKDWAKLTR